MSRCTNRACGRRGRSCDGRSGPEGARSRAGAGSATGRGLRPTKPDCTVGTRLRRCLVEPPDCPLRDQLHPVRDVVPSRERVFPPSTARWPRRRFLTPHPPAGAPGTRHACPVGRAAVRDGTAHSGLLHGVVERARERPVGRPPGDVGACSSTDWPRAGASAKRTDFGTGGSNSGSP